MKPYPKNKPVKLHSKAYRKLRREVYYDQLCKCIGCGSWVSLDCFSLHHKKTRGSGGGDTRENVDGYCLFCHPD